MYRLITIRLVTILACLHSTFGQWPHNVLHYGRFCEDMYGYKSCLRSVDCMHNHFLQCECVPRTLTKIFDKPMDGALLCMYTSHVMAVGKPSCCEHYYSSSSFKPRREDNNLPPNLDALAAATILGLHEKKNKRQRTFQKRQHVSDTISMRLPEMTPRRRVGLYDTGTATASRETPANIAIRLALPQVSDYNTGIPSDFVDSPTNEGTAADSSIYDNEYRHGLEELVKIIASYIGNRKGTHLRRVQNDTRISHGIGTVLGVPTSYLNRRIRADSRMLDSIKLREIDYEH